MSKTIWKYAVPYRHDTRWTFMFPGISPKVLHLGMQAGIPCLWVEVEPDLESGWTRSFEWVGTGHEVPSQSEYVGTVQDSGLVFHLYEVKW